MLPNVPGTKTLLLGFKKFTVLKRLKNSARNSNLVASVTGMNLTTLKSMLRWSRPRMMLRPEVPNGAAFAQVGAKAEVLKNRPSLSCTEPWIWSGGGEGRKSARLKSAEPNAPITEKGVPDWNVAMPASSQSFRNDFAHCESPS